MAIRIDGTNTTANPGITGADADTGLQFGTNELKIVTGGTEAITVDSSQNVGINTTNPGGPLEVQTASGERIIFDSAGSSQQPRIQLIRDDGADYSIQNGLGILEVLQNTDDIYRYSSNTHQFFTNGTEKVRISHNGYLLQGATALGTVGSVNGFQASNHLGVSSTGASIFSRRSSNGTVIHFRKNTTNVGSISVGASSTAFNTSSDHRLKENVIDLDGAIDRVKQLAPKRFNFIAYADTTVDGFLAHEAQTVVPEAVTGTHNEVDDDGNAVMQGIDQSKLVPLLTAALQEAIAKIETLETQNADLLARVTALENA